MSENSSPSDTSDSRGPAVRVPPPLVALTVLLASVALDRAVPSGLPYSPVLRIAGIIVTVAGLAIVAAAALSFHRAQTAIEPWKPTSQIIRNGVFSWSRNPVYLAFLLIQAGIGLCFANLWTLLMTPLTALLLWLIAIRPEERYLERKFGATYVSYQQSVRRWL